MIFTVIEDLEKTRHQPDRFLLLRWQDVQESSAAAQAAGVDEKTWTAVKMLYRLPDGPESASEVIERLESAYRERDRAAFARLLANDPEHAAEYLFLLAGTSGGESAWGYAEDTRIHQRMFDPQDIGPGEPEVPPEYWLQAINVSLTRITSWVERPELYRSETNPDGLPPEKWKVVDARYATYAFFDTQMDNDFLIEAEAIFTVIEDLEKSGAEPGRFQLLQWQDIDDEAQQKEERTWTGVRDLYR